MKICYGVCSNQWHFLKQVLDLAISFQGVQTLHLFEITVIVFTKTVLLFAVGVWLKLHFWRTPRQTWWRTTRGRYFLKPLDLSSFTWSVKNISLFPCVLQEEDLADEVFAQRHLALEQREKLHWAPWGRRKCCRRPKRWKDTHTHTLTHIHK